MSKGPLFVNRRRMLTITAAAGAAYLLPGIDRASSSSLTSEWRGYALGAEARLLFSGRDRDQINKAVTVCIAEIERLEKEFSLYRNNSSLCRLNRDGVLKLPNADMVDLLRRAKYFGDLSGGAFDISIQPLWQLYAEHFANPQADPGGPSQEKLNNALAAVDYRRISISPQEIRLAPGMALTLNGIAQGYITDRVANLLRDLGWSNILVELGEIRALDTHPDGGPWRVSVDGLTPHASNVTLDVVNRAVATSAASGFFFDPMGRHGHLIDPHSGDTPRQLESITVVTAHATDADALSTTLAVMPENQARLLAQKLRQAEIWVRDRTGMLIPFPV